MGDRDYWYALVGTEVIGPFDVLDEWYHEHAGPDWRHAQHVLTGVDPWQVARTELGDGRAVSTVFLGINHDWMRDSPLPIVFETIVVPEYDEVWRWCTWKDAAAGHEHIVFELGKDVWQREHRRRRRRA